MTEPVQISPDADTPRLNLRQRAKARTADRVLRAARTLFRKDGFEKATIRAIAAGVGMSTGAIFANYADKAELYRVAMGHDPLSPEAGLRLMDQLINLVTRLAHDASVDPEILEEPLAALDTLNPGWRVSANDLDAV